MYYHGKQMKVNDMGLACSTHEILSENMKEEFSSKEKEWTGG